MSIKIWGVYRFIVEFTGTYISLKSRIILPKRPNPAGRMLLSPIFPGMPTGLFIMEKDHLFHMAETLLTRFGCGLEVKKKLLELEKTSYCP